MGFKSFLKDTSHIGITRSRELLNEAEILSGNQSLKRFSGIAYDLAFDGVLSIEEMQLLLGVKQAVTGHKTTFNHTIEDTVSLYEPVSYTGLSRVESLKKNMAYLDLIWYENEIEESLFSYINETYYSKNEIIKDSILESYIDGNNEDMNVIVERVVGDLYKSRLKDYQRMIQTFDTIDLKMSLRNSKKVETIKNDTTFIKSLMIDEGGDKSIYSNRSIRFLYYEIADILSDWAELEMDYNQEDIEILKVPDSNSEGENILNSHTDPGLNQTIKKVSQDSKQEPESNFKGWVKNVFTSEKKDDRKKEKAIKRAERKKNRKLRRDS